MVNERGRDGPHGEKGPVTVFGPDFPFPFDDWIAHPACQSWLLTTQIECEESRSRQKIWTALDRTRCMQSSKTFVMVDRPYWKRYRPRTAAAS